MAHFKLSYFDFKGIRGEAVRMALNVGNLSFEDHRIPMDQWPQIKSQHPFNAVPVLYVDGKALAQANSILRYIGKIADLYPSDPWQAALCDQAMDAVEEVTVQLTATIPLSDEEKKTKRQALGAETLPVFLSGLENILKNSGGCYFGGDKISVADLRVYDLVRWLNSGLDYIPADLTERVAPELAKHLMRIKAEPRVKAYLNNYR